MEIRVLEVDGHHPSALWNEQEDGLYCCHTKLFVFQIDVEAPQVHDGLKTSVPLGHEEISQIETLSLMFDGNRFDS